MSDNSCKHFIAYYCKYGVKALSGVHSYFSVCITKQARRRKALSCLCYTCGSSGPQLYACLHCIHFACKGKHITDHMNEQGHEISLELNYGMLYCHSCHDFIYNTEFQEIAQQQLRHEAKLLNAANVSWRPWTTSRTELETLLRHTKRRTVSHFTNIVGLRGLLNLGSTCFMNCIVQALMHTPLLRDYFLSGRHECNIKYSLRCLVCELSRLFQEFYSGAKTPLSLHRLLHMIWTQAKHLAGYEQQDAHEFFIATLDVLHRHCVNSQMANNLIKERNSNKNQAGTSNGIHNNSSSNNNIKNSSTTTTTTTNHNSINVNPTTMSPTSSTNPNQCNCIIDRIFTGGLQSDVVCQSCKGVSTTIDPFWDISLDLGEAHQGWEPPKTLNDCLERFTRAEYLGSNAKIKCSSCQSYQESTKQLTMRSLPIVASFHLKRFEHSSFVEKKISTFIAFPSELDMTPFMSQTKRSDTTTTNSDYRYSLYAVVNHVGSLDAGHYTAYVRHQKDIWVKCDDHLITRATLQQALSCLCYTCGSSGPQLYACLHCIHFACKGKHITDHMNEQGHEISLELNYGMLYCHSCHDFIYNTEFQEIAQQQLRHEAKLLNAANVSWRPWTTSRTELETLLRHTKRRTVSHFTNIVGLRGLLNLGSTCFMNCIVQALMHTPLLRDYFLSGRHECNIKYSLRCLVCELSRLFQEFYSGAKTPLSLHRLLHMIWTQAKHLAGYEQQDAHEFFIATLDVLHRHCVNSQMANNLIKERNSNKNQAGTSNGIHNNSSSNNNIKNSSTTTTTTTNHNSINVNPTTMSPTSSTNPNQCNCIIDRIFTGGLQSDVVCQSCKGVSTTIDPFWDISLDLGEAHQGWEPPKTLNDCLERFTRAEYLGSNAKIKCSSCQSYQESTKQLTMRSLPIVASFHLKRFEHSSFVEKKISTFIAFPSELDMTPFMSQTKRSDTTTTNSDYRYSLYAVVNHVGSLDAGHYTAYVRHQKDIWVKCDDHLITRATLQQVLDSEV